MTLPERLAAFERLAAEATPGPYAVGKPDRETPNGYIPINGVKWWSFALVVSEVEGEPDEEGDANAAYIASLPGLLKLAQDQDARIRELERMLAQTASESVVAMLANGEPT